VAEGRRNSEVDPGELAVIEEISTTLNVSAPNSFRASFVSPNSKHRGPLFITIGNEKGGTGKSTTAMILAVSLLDLGYTVGSIDLDGRQGTLSRYLTNRRALAEAMDQHIPMPIHQRITGSEASDRNEAISQDMAWLRDAFCKLADCQVVVIDTPGSSSHLCRLGHMHADILITPMNDTLLDIDILAHIDPNKREVLAPSAYCRMVWEQNERRLLNNRKPIDWLVMRNRLTYLDTHNKRAIAHLLERLAERIGFRIATGFGERVIFHELFLTGLTVLDLPDDRVRGWNNISLTHARQEIRALLLALGFPALELQPHAAATPRSKSAPPKNRTKSGDSTGPIHQRSGALSDKDRKTLQKIIKRVSLHTGTLDEEQEQANTSPGPDAAPEANKKAKDRAASGPAPCT
jgi:chromosome partitioning protein